jgi:uncharacterized protein (TIGR01777 family)
MPKILITGASGLIGKPLTESLLAKGCTVNHLSRTENLAGTVKAYKWDIEKGYIDHKALEGVDVIIHLAGAGIADKKWTDKRKQEIIDSRVKSSTLLINAIKDSKINLKKFIGASAIGYYGAVTNEHIYKEEDAPATDFLGSVCKQWEDSYLQLPDSVIKAIIRISVVLSDKGGALSKMQKTAKLGISSPLGSGKQYVPWIHLDDLVNVFTQAALSDSLLGIYNACSPQHLTNKQLTKALAKSLKRPCFMPNVPSFLLKIIFGEMAAVVLDGSRASSNKLLSTGFTFMLPTVEAALNNLYSETK